MLSPVLEVYVAWHPADDAAGRALVTRLVEHFHGNAYVGLQGGAIEVFARSVGWNGPDDAPRPLPALEVPAGEDAGTVPATALTAVVVWTGLGLARAVERPDSPWAHWLQGLQAQQAAAPDRLRVLPMRPASGGAPAEARLNSLLPQQAITDESPAAANRDLAQALAQWAQAGAGADAPRLEVFISHTKHDDAGSDRVAKLIAQVRQRIDGASRLGSFFDSNALQAGADWDAHLRAGASRMALLALRTDLYASREWCQREMLLAKRHGVPVVILDALVGGEDRGSFLMDHVVRVPVRWLGDGWAGDGIDAALARLVDACLQRALWQHPARGAALPPELSIDWWAPSAPEPATLLDRLEAAATATAARDPMRILHPDPPLGPEERDVLERIARLAGRPGLDILTPRLLAARGI